MTERGSVRIDARQWRAERTHGVECRWAIGGTTMTAAQRDYADVGQRRS